jgi:hypothetical protein
MKAIFFILLVAFASCNTEEQEPELQVDINGIIKCINEVAPLVPDVIEIITFIKTADWAQVAIKAVELVSKGIPAVKDCIAAFKKETLLEAVVITNVVYNVCSQCLSAANPTKCVQTCKAKNSISYV